MAAEVKRVLLYLFACLVVDHELAYRHPAVVAGVWVILILGCCGERIACQRPGVYTVLTQRALSFGSGLGVLPHRRGHLFINSYIIPY
jgi:hypothetical protein